ncbi:MAG: PDR/VanB family oxidoreductase [Burkholderiaceae bacterium]
MSPNPPEIALTLVGKSPLTPDIWQLELRAEAPLPVIEPGAHLAVRTPIGAMRQYSIISADDRRIDIAVKREPGGRGGSRSLIDETTVGEQVHAQPPENHFGLEDAPSYLFIAGGIGITPVLSMIRALLARETVPPFTLIYCTRTPAMTPFRDELARLPAGSMVLHHDHGDPAQAYDFWPLLETPDARHIYCCGPAPLMDSIRDMVGHWPSRSVHFEDFQPVKALRAADQAFEVRFLDDAPALTVRADQTLLQALRDAGLSVASSCESGTCGTCRMPFLEGEIEHRDLVLTPAERAGELICCVSRARDDTLRLAVPGPTGKDRD